MYTAGRGMQMDTIKQLGCEAWKLCQCSGWWMFCQFRQRLTRRFFLPDQRRLLQIQRLGDHSYYFGFFFTSGTTSLSGNYIIRQDL
jgi:hypothetical protein